MKSRRGYVLLSVLWFLTGGVALATAAMLSARSGIATASNRAALLRAEWQAEECLARTRAAMFADHVESASAESGAVLRQGLASRARVMQSSLVAACPGTVVLEPVGAGVSLQNVNGTLLAKVLKAAGVPSSPTDSMVDAFLDWRDEDDSTRALGAEYDWYSMRGLPTPRNSELAAVDELLLIRGFGDWFGPEGMLDHQRLFSVDSDKIFLDAAPSEVLTALPGFGVEAVAYFAERRSRNAEPLQSLMALTGGFSDQSREEMTRSLSELESIATVVPEGWLLRARSSGVPSEPRASRLLVEIELRLASSGQRHSVVRRRISP